MPEESKDVENIEEHKATKKDVMSVLRYWGLIAFIIILVVVLFLSLRKSITLSDEHSVKVKVLKTEIQQSNDIMLYKTYFKDITTDQVYTTSSIQVYNKCKNKIDEEAFIYIGQVKSAGYKSNYIITKVVPLWLDE